MKSKVGRRRREIKVDAPCGNFIIAIDGKVRGGWANSSPSHLQTVMDDVKTQCEANDIDMSLAGVEAIVNHMLIDPADLEQAEGAIILYWLAHKDPSWPLMMQYFGRGYDFKVDVSKATGQVAATVHVMPTPEESSSADSN